MKRLISSAPSPHHPYSHSSEAFPLLFLPSSRHRSDSFRASFLSPTYPLHRLNSIHFSPKSNSRWATFCPVYLLLPACTRHFRTWASSRSTIRKNTIWKNSRSEISFKYIRIANLFYRFVYIHILYINVLFKIKIKIKLLIYQNYYAGIKLKN